MSSPCVSPLSSSNSIPRINTPPPLHLHSHLHLHARTRTHRRTQSRPAPSNVQPKKSSASKPKSSPYTLSFHLSITFASNKQSFPSPPQHALRRRARRLPTVAISRDVDANPSSDSDAIDNDNDHADSRPRPSVPSRATRGPGSASGNITGSTTHERALVVVRRSSATRPRPPPRPFARTRIRG